MYKSGAPNQFLGGLFTLFISQHTVDNPLIQAIIRKTFEDLFQDNYLRYKEYQSMSSIALVLLLIISERTFKTGIYGPQHPDRNKILLGPSDRTGAPPSEGNYKMKTFTITEIQRRYPMMYVLQRFIQTLIDENGYDVSIKQRLKAI